jgi:hypothetical protein
LWEHSSDGASSKHLQEWGYLGITFSNLSETNGLVDGNNNSCHGIEEIIIDQNLEERFLSCVVDLLVKITLNWLQKFLLLFSHQIEMSWRKLKFHIFVCEFYVLSELNSIDKRNKWHDSVHWEVWHNLFFAG